MASQVVCFLIIKGKPFGLPLRKLFLIDYLCKLSNECSYQPNGDAVSPCIHNVTICCPIVLTSEIPFPQGTHSASQSCSHFSLVLPHYCRFSTLKNTGLPPDQKMILLYCSVQKSSPNPVIERECQLSCFLCKSKKDM